MRGDVPGEEAPHWREACRRREREIVVAALAAQGWNVSATARELKMSRVGLHKKMRALAIMRPESTT